MKNDTQKYIAENERKCASLFCREPIRVGDSAVKVYRNGLAPKDYHFTCWRKRSK